MKRKKRINIRFITLGILLVIYIFPFFLVLINALKEKTDIIRDPLALVGEQGATFANFIEAADRMHFFRALGNSLLITVVSTALIVIFS